MARRNPNLYLNHTITKEWCQPIGDRVSYPTESHYATRPGLSTVYKHRLLALNASVIVKTGIWPQAEVGVLPPVCIIFSFQQIHTVMKM